MWEWQPSDGSGNDDDDDDGCLFWKESVAVKKCGWKMTFQWHPLKQMMDGAQTIFLAAS